MVTFNKNAKKIANFLYSANPHPKTELDFKNEYELVVAVMLSAQTTDKKVNQVTPPLFDRYPSWGFLADADVADLEKIIKQVNFYKGKSQRLVDAAKFIITEFKNKLPNTINELIKIPGIARKSANVIMQEAWGVTQGIVVDTHVTRVSQRLGLTENKDPVKIEKDLMKQIPKDLWLNFSGNLVLHGRYICIARKPKCQECILANLCPSAGL